jgi:hypothetical protein
MFFSSGTTETFAAQLEVLKRYRTGGEQKVTSHPDETEVFLPESSAMLGNLEAHARAVQGSRGAGLDRMPLPRCARWSAEGQGERSLSARAFYRGGY